MLKKTCLLLAFVGIAFSGVMHAMTQHLSSYRVYFNRYAVTSHPIVEFRDGCWRPVVMQCGYCG